MLFDIDKNFLDLLDTTPKPIKAPEPQSYNDEGDGITRGCIWWVEGNVIEVDFWQKG